MDVAIFGMITTMMISMGLGSFAARKITNPFTGFAWLESLLALIGASATLIIGAIFALSYLLPQSLADTFALPRDLIPEGGVLQSLAQFTRLSPYLLGALLGFLIGIEIPLIGRIRAELYQDWRRNDPGAIYGIDYIGAGIGATLWIVAMLSLPVTLAASMTAAVNLLLGLTFFALFRQRIGHAGALLLVNATVALIILQIASYGSDWDHAMEDLIYRDEVVLRHNTRFQRLVVTSRQLSPTEPEVIFFHINGRTQFSSADEHIYHAMLTYPPMVANPHRHHILIIGGGDGLALRDILRWNPDTVTLLDLDSELVDLFTRPLELQGSVVNQRLLQLNQHAFSDPRVKTHFGDAFITIDSLIEAQRLFDVVIIDLPDPNHPDLNKLYSSRFYSKIRMVMAGDAVLSLQSTSPYHAKRAFLSIGKTLKHAGFTHVEPYHANVPSFGEWGWHLATLNDPPASERIATAAEMPVDDGWTTKGVLLAAFQFSRHYFDEVESIAINRLGSLATYQYHHKDWQREMGIVPNQKRVALPNEGD